MVPIGLAWAAALAAAPGAAQAGADCRLDPATGRWVQSVIDQWTIVRTHLLKQPPGKLPWMIFFDSRCAWHVAPARAIDGARPTTYRLRNGRAAVTSMTVRHDGRIRLPTGQMIGAQPLAFTAPDPASESGFFVIALADLWRPAWKPSDPPIEAFFHGVAMHELTHTLQTGSVLPRAASLMKGAGLAGPLNDDIVQNQFRGDPGYVALFEQERDTLFAAIAEPDDARARSLARDALAMAAARRDRYFVGKLAVLRELETLFLNMEGLAGWVAYAMARRDPARFAAQDDILTSRGRSTDWVQGQGLALALLMARFAPDWQAALLRPDPASPFAILEGALAPPASGS